MVSEAFKQANRCGKGAPMRAMLTGLIGASLLASGCSRDPVTTVPGHLQPGPSIEIAEQAIGGGGGRNGSTSTVGRVPVIAWDAPNVPLMVDGEVDLIYFLPTESRDGEALRFGHYAAVKVREQSFTVSHRHATKSLLNREDADRIQRYGMIPDSARLEKRTPTQRGKPLLPYGEQTQETTRVSVVEVSPTGQANVVGTGRVQMPAPGSAVNGQDPTTEAALRMLDQFNRAQSGASQSGGTGE